MRMIQFRNRANEGGGVLKIEHRTAAAEAIELLESTRFDLILLDHDLGGRTYVDFSDEKEDCGMRVAEWFSIRPERVSQQGPIIVHSLNGPAAQQMVELIGEASWIPFVWTADVWRKFLKIPVLHDDRHAPV